MSEEKQNDENKIEEKEVKEIKQETNEIKKEVKEVSTNVKVLIILLVCALIAGLVAVWYVFIDKRETGFSSIKNVVKCDQNILSDGFEKTKIGDEIELSQKQFLEAVVGCVGQKVTNKTDAQYDISYDTICKLGKKFYKTTITGTIVNGNFDIQYKAKVNEEVDGVDDLYEVGYKVLTDNTENVTNIAYKEYGTERASFTADYKGKTYFVSIDNGFYDISIAEATDEQKNMPTIEQQQ